MVAQVTIGSAKAPVAGALLMLDDGTAGANNVNSTKGLGLPRVKLTDKDNLFPMFETVVESGIANSNYDNTTKKELQDEIHTGMVVYSANACAGFNKGLYVWDGKKWSSILPEDAFGITVDGTDLELYSGIDERGANTEVPLNIAWGQSDLKLSWKIENKAGGGVLFTTEISPTSPLSSTPTIMKLKPDAIILNPTSPWASRESEMTFTLVNECGETDVKKIMLNQTNYALKINNSFDNLYLNSFDSNDINLDLLGNVAWLATESDPDNILTIKSTTSGGADDNTGNTNNSSFKFNVSDSDRYSEGTITFKDSRTSSPRIKDITVKVVQCEGQPNMSTLSPGVLAHTDQSGNTFYSNDFGATAGRWMITNMAATSYDAVRTSTDTHISKPITNPTTKYIFTVSEPYWAYPAPDGNLDPTIRTYYDDNPFIGRLYTWAGATNMKGGADGLGYWGNEAGKQHARIQGICPRGWHLPSDYEWTLLENEILANYSKYTTLPDLENPPIFDPTDDGGTIFTEIGGYNRGDDEQLGVAMKDVCELGSEGLVGASLPPNKGGFSGWRPGLAQSLSPANQKEMKTVGWGTRGYYWSSSSFKRGDVPAMSIHNASALCRCLVSEYNAMHRANYNRYNYFPVRCKQD